MVVSEGAISNIMSGMENTSGVRLHSHRHKLKQRFDIIRKLGQGTYGKVQLAVNKETGQEVAIKTIKKAKIETDQDLIRIRREIQIMSSVQHPQIIHIYEVFENREKMVLVMEYAAGGELYDYLSDRKVLPEEEARRVFRQVATAVYYCHKHKICHRDLKLENILLDLDGNAKIADFGLSNVFHEKRRLDTFCGSPLYASPEIVKGIPYLGPEVDCWSLGVLLYTLVYGAMPFDGSNFRRLVKQITQGDFYEPANPSRASDLIKQMLTVKSTERANIEDICKHWWVNEGYKSCCFKEAEFLANQTPVRLDLLLSLAPKDVDTEHLLIPEESANESQTAVDSSRESSSDLISRSQSAGTVPPKSSSIDDLIEKRRQERQENDEKEKKKKKKDPSRKASLKRKTSPSEENKIIEQKNNKTTDEKLSETEADENVKKKSVKSKDSLKTEKKKVKKKDSSNSIVTPEQSSEPVPNENIVTPTKTETDKYTEDEKISSSEIDKIKPKKVPKRISKDKSDKTISTEKQNKLDTPKDKSSRELISRVDNKPVEDTKSPAEVKSPIETETDTEKILMETAAKIEAVEAALAAESQQRDKDISTKSPPSGLVSPSSAPKSPASDQKSPASGPKSPASAMSSSVVSPNRSRTGSESSGGGSSRRQSKIFSKAAMFDNMAAQSKSPTPEKPKKVIKPGSLNISDLSKKFEEKAPTEKKNKVIIPQKVSDAKKAFESKTEKSSSTSPVHKSSRPSSPPSSISKNNISENSSIKNEKSLGSRRSEEKENAPKKSQKPLEKEPEPKVKDITEIKHKSPVKESKKDSGECLDNKPQKSGSKERKIQIKMESESSESESEAEIMLKSLAKKREQLEKAKAQKLKRVEDGEAMPSIKEESRTPTPARHVARKLSSENDTKFATLPKSFKAKEDAKKPIPSFKEDAKDSSRKKTQMQIVLDNSQSNLRDNSQSTIRDNNQPTLRDNSQSNLRDNSQSTLRDSSQSTLRDYSQSSIRSNERSNKFNVTSQSPQKYPEHQQSQTSLIGSQDSVQVEPHLQRARRERIIPIMLEDEGGEASVPVTPLPTIPSSSSYKPPPAQPRSEQIYERMSTEPIQKSRRERIIPISVEGEGIVTPPVSTSSSFRRPQQHSSSNRRSKLNIDRSESFSSAGEDDDEEDGFEILTAEKLFSTLLNRVRSLTRKMTDDPRDLRRYRMGDQGEFWSQFYTPGEAPTSQFGQPLWNHSLSREPSDSESVFSESGSVFNAPRGLLHEKRLIPPCSLLNDPFFRT